MDDPVTHEDGETDARQNEAFERMAEFLREYIESHGGTYQVYEMGTFMYLIFWRLRQVLSFPQLCSYVGHMINVTERGLHSARQEEDNQVILAEDWQGMEGGQEMLQDLATIARADEEDLVIPSDWLSEEE